VCPEKERKHMKKLSVIGLFSLVVSLLVAYSAHAQVVYLDEGFEWADSVLNHGWNIVPSGDTDSMFTRSDLAHSGLRSLYMDSSDDVEQHLNYQFSQTLTNVRVEAYMYDDLADDDFETLCIGHDGYPLAYMGYRGPLSNEYYATAAGTLGSWEVTTVPRTAGWHKLVFEVRPEGLDYYVDDIYVRTSTHLTEINWIRLKSGNHGYGPALGNVYFDDVLVKELGAQDVALDVKPGSCPNPLNKKGGGVLPVAIAGDAGLDVYDIDPGSLELAGIAPLRYSYEDVASPYYPSGGCNCIQGGADGTMDLTLKFDKKAVLNALGEVSVGDEILLSITGLLTNGSEIKGVDCIVINNE
jgi:hypothetical protein